MSILSLIGTLGILRVAKDDSFENFAAEIRDPMRLAEAAGSRLVIRFEPRPAATPVR